MKFLLLISLRCRPISPSSQEASKEIFLTDSHPKQYSSDPTPDNFSLGISKYKISMMLSGTNFTSSLVYPDKYEPPPRFEVFTWKFACSSRLGANLVLGIPINAENHILFMIE